MPVNSRAKGVRGELAVRDMIRAMGFEAQRSQQYNGNAGGADVTTSIEGLHVEVKNTNRLSPYQFMLQAQRDAKGAIPSVWMHSDNEPWLIVIKADDLLQFVDVIQRARVQP